MKKLLLLTVISALLIIFIPPVTYGAVADKPPAEENTNGETIRVFLASENTAVTMDFREYITGVVAAEMPVEFHEEALSAAACAAATRSTPSSATAASATSPWYSSARRITS